MMPTQSWTLPHPALRPYIDRYWRWAGETATPLPLLLPGTGAELTFHLRRPFIVAPEAAAPWRAPLAHLGCMRRRPLRLFADGPFAFISVRIRSGALRHLCPAPLAELFDGLIPVEDIWGRAAATLTERLAATPALAMQARLLDDWLLARLAVFEQTDKLIDHAVDQIYYRHADLKLENLAAELGLSLRQFERRFKHAIGRSPKSFHRAARFHQTTRALMLAPQRDTLDTALAHGYYDQAHFIREFSGFVGNTPARFLSGPEGRSHFYNPSLPRSP